MRGVIWRVQCYYVVFLYFFTAYGSSFFRGKEPLLLCQGRCYGSYMRGLSGDCTGGYNMDGSGRLLYDGNCTKMEKMNTRGGESMYHKNPQ